MKEREPRRLLDSADSPVQLLAALSALAERAPSDETVVRVQRALQTAAAAPPSSALTAAAKLTLVGSGAAALLMAAAMLSHGGPESSRGAQIGPNQSASPVTSLDHSLPTLIDPAGERQEIASTAAAAQGGTAPSTTKPHIPAAAEKKPKPHAAEAAPRGGSARRQPADTTAVVSGTASAADTALSPSEARALERTPAIAPTPLPAAAPQDEAGLLYRAKRLAMTDAAAALPLLELHARYFPSGNLREEREALVIRVHIKLGHTERARQLAAAFRVRYPGSVYSSSLPP